MWTGQPSKANTKAWQSLHDRTKQTRHKPQVQKADYRPNSGPPIQMPSCKTMAVGLGHLNREPRDWASSGAVSTSTFGQNSAPPIHTLGDDT